MKFHNQKKMLILILTWLLTLCSSPKAPFSQLDIIGGTRPLATSPAYKSTVALVKTKNGEPGAFSIFCSGTLIARNLVVTASHCLDNRHKANFKVLFGPSDRVGDGLVVDVLEYQVFHHDWSKFSPNLDVAWVKIAQNAPDGYEPIEILHDHATFPVGESGADDYLLAGFGQQKTRCLDDDCAGIKLEVSSPLRDPIYRNSRLFSILVFGKTPNKGICSGDSGGSVFYKKNNKWYLIGTLNGHKDTLTPDAFKNHDEACESGESIYNFLGDYASWIEDSSGISLGYDSVLNKRTAPIEIMSEESMSELKDFSHWYAYNNYNTDAWYTVDAIIKAALLAEEGENRLLMYRDPDRVLEHFIKSPKLEVVSVEDIRPILGLPLESLYLVSNNLSQYVLLGNMPKLRSLSVAAGLFRTGKFDPSFINELKKLRYLSLTDIPNIDFSKINWQELPHLEELHLNNVGVTDLDFFGDKSRPPSLGKITIDYNKVFTFPVTLRFD